MKLRFLNILFVISLVLWPQASLAEKKILTVSLDRREIRDLSSEGLILVFFLKIANSTAYPYYLAQVDYRVVIREKDYFSLKLPLQEPILIPAMGESSISFPIRISYSFLLEAVAGIEEEPRVSSYVTGLMMFSDGRRIREKAPFAFSADFPIFRNLEVEFHTIEVNAISVGGTEFIFAFTLKNPNRFDLEIDSFAYELRLGGKIATAGELRIRERIESQGEKKVFLPVVLDFFEVGQDLHAILEQSWADCELLVELRAGTAWGNLEIELSRKEVVAIKKKSDGLHYHPHL